MERKGRSPWFYRHEWLNRHFDTQSSKEDAELPKEQNRRDDEPHNPDPGDTIDA